MEELAARRQALDSERRALEEEEERLRAAAVAAATGRDEVEGRIKEAEGELARARSEVEAARERDNQVPPPSLALLVLSLRVCFPNVKVYAALKSIEGTYTRMIKR